MWECRWRMWRTGSFGCFEGGRRGAGASGPRDCDAKPTEAQFEAATAQAAALAEMGAAVADIKDAKAALAASPGSANAKAALAAAYSRLEKAEEAKMKADAAREQADKEAGDLEEDDESSPDDDEETDEADGGMNVDQDGYDISDCRMAAARAIIECLIPMATDDGSFGGMTCESVAPELDALKPEILTTEVNGGACSCDTTTPDQSSDIQGQMALIADGGGIVDPSPEP